MAKLSIKTNLLMTKFDKRIYHCYNEYIIIQGRIYMQNDNQILVVFTGGTICTTIKDGMISLDPQATSALIDFYQKSDSVFKSTVSFHKGKLFGILSENMTINKWNEIITYFQELIPTFSNYKGVIIAHGTDTLAYSAALFSLLLKGTPIPVFFVSSNYSIVRSDGLPNPKSNGNINFRAAVECICMGIAPGVYATYKNSSDQKVYLHKASHLIQCRIYDENFYSIDALDITDFNGLNLEKFSQNITTELSEIPIMKLGNQRLKNCILKIEPYVGLNYDAFNYSSFQAVLHGTYHSGTACVEKDYSQKEYSQNSILYMIDKCAEKNVDVYFSPSKVEPGYAVYDTVPLIKDHIANGQKATICYGMTTEMLYAKLLLAYSLDFTKTERTSFLKNINNEYIDE